MASNPVNANVAAILQGVRKDFVGVYEPRLKQADVELAAIMSLDKTATGRIERYAYPEAPPNMTRWEYGQPIPTGGFRLRAWQHSVLRWGKRIEWFTDDEEDDQTGSLRPQALRLADRAALIPQRVAFQQIAGGTADPDLLPAALLGPDGVAMHSATDGEGAARYGVTGGNIIAQGTSSGVASEAALEKDLFQVDQRFRAMKDQAGRRRWTGPDVDQGFVVVASSGISEVMKKAFMRGPITIATLGGSTTAAGVSPVTGGMVRKLILTAELTGNAWYTFLAAAPEPPMFMATRLPANIYVKDEKNGDHNSDFDMRSVYAKMRALFGLGPCDSTIKVDVA